VNEEHLSRFRQEQAHTASTIALPAKAVAGLEKQPPEIQQQDFDVSIQPDSVLLSVALSQSPQFSVSLRLTRIQWTLSVYPSWSTQRRNIRMRKKSDVAPVRAVDAMDQFGQPDRQCTHAKLFCSTLPALGTC
jgi:hypothetical protein